MRQKLASYKKNVYNLYNLFSFFSIKYLIYVQLSDENLRKARQQVLDIMKLAFAFAAYNGAEMLQDRYLIAEFHYFTLALSNDIILRVLFVSFDTIFINILVLFNFCWLLFDIYWFRANQDRAFPWLHKKIDENSPACNPMFYVIHLYVARCLKTRLSQSDPDRSMWVL